GASPGGRAEFSEDAHLDDPRARVRPQSLRRRATGRQTSRTRTPNVGTDVSTRGRGPEGNPNGRDGLPPGRPVQKQKADGRSRKQVKTRRQPGRVRPGCL